MRKAPGPGQRAVAAAVGCRHRVGDERERRLRRGQPAGSPEERFAGTRCWPSSVKPATTCPRPRKNRSTAVGRSRALRQRACPTSPGSLARLARDGRRSSDVGKRLFFGGGFCKVANKRRGSRRTFTFARRFANHGRDTALRGRCSEQKAGPFPDPRWSNPRSRANPPSGRARRFGVHPSRSGTDEGRTRCRRSPSAT